MIVTWYFVIHKYLPVFAGHVPPRLPLGSKPGLEHLTESQYYAARSRH